MTDLSNYGTLLYVQTTSGSLSSGSVIAGLVKIDPPKIKNPKIKATNHSSGGKAAFVSSGLVEIDDFKCTFSFDATAMGDMYDKCVAGTMGYYKILYPNTQAWYFGALVTEFQAGGADANSPELLQADVTFSPSGEMLIV